jgi:hypothetical protein
MSVRYVAALPVAVVVSGKERVVAKGEDLPDGVAEAVLTALLRMGYVVPVDRPGDNPVDVDEDLVFDGPPAKGAKKSVWEAYAAQVGLAGTDIAGLDKAALIDAALAASGGHVDEDGDSPDSGE